jgi:hypothetical protein
MRGFRRTCADLSAAGVFSMLTSRRFLKKNDQINTAGDGRRIAITRQRLWVAMQWQPDEITGELWN